MLTPGQEEDITAVIEDFLDPITIAENRDERCDYGCRMHTVITPVAQHLTRKLAPLIEQWITDATETERAKAQRFAAIIGRLTSNANASITEEAFTEWLITGELPKGWERETEFSIRHEGGREAGTEGWARYFAATENRRELQLMLRAAVEGVSAEQRTVITGPWEATDE